MFPIPSQISQPYPPPEDNETLHRYMRMQHLPQTPSDPLMFPSASFPGLVQPTGSDGPAEEIAIPSATYPPSLAFAALMQDHYFEPQLNAWPLSMLPIVPAEGLLLPGISPSAGAEDRAPDTGSNSTSSGPGKGVSIGETFTREAPIPDVVADAGSSHANNVSPPEIPTSSPKETPASKAAAEDGVPPLEGKEVIADSASKASGASRPSNLFASPVGPSEARQPPKYIAPAPAAKSDANASKLPCRTKRREAAQKPRPQPLSPLSRRPLANASTLALNSQGEGGPLQKSPGFQDTIICRWGARFGGCRKRCAGKQAHDRHVATHLKEDDGTDLTLFRCEKCGDKLSRQDAGTRHINKFHKGESPQIVKKLPRPWWWPVEIFYTNEWRSGIILPPPSSTQNWEAHIRSVLARNAAQNQTPTAGGSAPKRRRIA